MSNGRQRALKGLDRDQRYWERQARHYDLAVTLFNLRVHQAAREVADAMAGLGTVVEFGAGTGVFTAPLAKKVKRVIATDLTPGMLALLRQRMESQGITNVETRVMDATASELPEGEYDGVLAAALLHLLPDPEAVVRGFAKLVRPGGLITLPTYLHEQGRRSRVISRLMELARFPIVTRFDLESLRRCVGRAGLIVEHEKVFRGNLTLATVIARTPAG